LASWLHGLCPAKANVVLQNSDFGLRSDFDLRISDFKPVTIGCTEITEAPTILKPASVLEVEITFAVSR